MTGFNIHTLLRRAALLVLTGIVMGSNCVANESEDMHILFIPTNSGGQYGLIQTSGSLLAAPQYRDMHQLLDSEGKHQSLMVTDENGLVGYLDNQGQPLYPIELQEGKVFTEMRVARVKKGGKWGYLKDDGEFLIPPQFAAAGPMQFGYAAVSNGDGFYLINPQGESILKKRFAGLNIISSSGLLKFQQKKDSPIGLMALDGTIVKKPQFSFVGDLNENGRAVAGVDQGDYSSKWGVIDERGNWVAEPVYDYIEPNWSGGYTVASRHSANQEFVIDDSGAEIFTVDGTNVRISAACNRVCYGYYRLKFYDLQGNEIKALNDANYDWFSGFGDDCTGWAYHQRRGWGLLKADDTFKPFPESIVEPVTSGYDSSIQSAYLDFLPVIDKQRQLAYLNRDGEIAFTTEVASDANADQFHLNNVDGKRIWQFEFEKDSLPLKHPYFFSPQSQDLGFDKAWLADIRPLVESLQQGKPRPFSIWSIWSRHDGKTFDPYDIDLSDIDNLPYGAVQILASRFISEEEAGQYAFLQDQNTTSELFANTLAQLVERFGKPLRLTDELQESLFDDNNIQSGDIGLTEDNVATWLIGDSRLVLLESFFVGDGEFETVLSLALLPPASEQLAKTEAFRADIALIETADKSDKAVADAVHELSGSTSSAMATRQLAGKVIELIESGKEISEYDYLWTLYALVSSAYPELENGLPRDEYLEIVDTALAYLDGHGAGDWVFTDIGQFKMEVYRKAGNGAAWELRESDPPRALKYIQAAMRHARDEDLWMQDTYARVLLNLGETDKAYAAIHAVLKQDPDFEDFQEFKQDQGYQAWQQQMSRQN